MEKVVFGYSNLNGCLSAFPREGVSLSTIFSSFVSFQRLHLNSIGFPVRYTLWPLYALFSTAIQGLKGSQNL
ncbi:hypothetical protein [Winslowiella iniecta]|uniref:hypothetical protein n=1 Tax=Winslowiella iniecta TaxID=1560201 RepID=UPI0012E20713|nr:hypothetical protein [Winslowiella iniecta]